MDLLGPAPQGLVADLALQVLDSVPGVAKGGLIMLGGEEVPGALQI